MIKILNADSSSIGVYIPKKTCGIAAAIPVSIVESQHDTRQGTILNVYSV